jgi:hypothetical protein
MPRLFVVACALAGCGGTAPTPPAAPTSTADHALAAPPRASFEVVPAELGDAGVLERIRHRTRVRHVGETSLRPQKRPPTPGVEVTADANYVLPVINETEAQIQVVVEDDHVRLALWVDRIDTWSTVIGAVQLSERDGHADQLTGVWLEPGATIASHDLVDKRREIEVVDPALEIRGWVPAAFVGHVWLADRGDVPRLVLEETPWQPPEDHRVHGRVALGALIRSAPAAKAPVIAKTTEEVFATIGRAYDGFTEIELHRPQLRVHGYVDAHHVDHALEAPLGHGSGRGHGFGISHSDRIEVPAGTCLFDEANGEVVGVQIEPSIRLGQLRGPVVGWAMVYVENPFSIAAQLYVRAMRDDPNDPHWEPCTEPVHHR